MTNQERTVITEHYEISMKLACSYYYTKDYETCRQILYAVSAPMALAQEAGTFAYLNNKWLDAILADWKIDKVEFTTKMLGE